MASSGYISKITLPNGTQWDIKDAKLNGHTVNSDVPAGAVFTDTTYSLVGAQGTTGLVKNGSDVVDTTLYVPTPIVGGVPYYSDEIAKYVYDDETQTLEYETELAVQETLSSITNSEIDAIMQNSSYFSVSQNSSTGVVSIS